MKILIYIALLIISSSELYSQGTNNNFDYDGEDFNLIFNELGIKTLKYPIMQNTNEYLNVIYEEYENKTLVRKISMIDDVKESFGKYGVNGLTYFKPQRDSIYFHRFYFINKDSILKIKYKALGIESLKEFNLKGKSSFNVNTDNKVYDELLTNNQYIKVKDEPNLYLYGNSIEGRQTSLVS